MNFKKIISSSLICCTLLTGTAYGADIDNNKEVSVISTAAVQQKMFNPIITQNVKLEAGKVNKVKVNQNFYVTLEENASTGYVWSYSADNDAIKLVNQKSVYLGDKNVVGAPSQVTWTFKANKKGTYKIQYKYARPWSKNDANEKNVEYNVEVTEDNNTNTDLINFLNNVNNFMKSVYEKIFHVNK